MSTSTHAKENYRTNSDTVQVQVQALIATVDMRLYGMVGNPKQNIDPSSRANQTDPEQEITMAKLKPVKKSSKKHAKPEPKGKIAKKKGKKVEDEDDDEDETEEDDDDDEGDDDDDDEGDDIESDDDDEEESDDDDDEEEDDDSDDEDEEESDDDEEEDDDEDEEESDDDEDEEESDDDDEESDDEEESDEEEEASVTPKLKNGSYQITKNDSTFEVVEGRGGSYKKGDQVKVGRAIVAKYSKSTVIEVAGAKDTAKRTWVVLEAKGKHVVVPVEFVLTAKGKPAGILETEAEEAPKSKKGAKAAKKGAKEEKAEKSTGSNKKLIKRLDAAIAELSEIRESL